MIYFIISFAAMLIWLFSIVFIAVVEDFECVNRFTKILLVIFAPIVVIVVMTMYLGARVGQWFNSIQLVLACFLIFSLSACQTEPENRIVLTSVNDGQVLTMPEPPFTYNIGDTIIISSIDRHSSVRNKGIYGKYRGVIPQKQIINDIKQVTYSLYIIESKLLK